MEYVIIGNSAAAIGAVEGIRQHDKSSGITIISAEKHHTYSRPLISYLLQGKTDIERMKYRSGDFYEKNGCKCIFSKRVIKINANNRSVVLDGGDILRYDKLLAATGSSAFIPPFEGLDAVEKKFTFISLDDALQLKDSVNKNSRVFIVGAGLIGLKCAEGIAGLCESVTVADLSDRVLSSVLDSDGSAIVQYVLENNGLRLLLGKSVVRFDKNTAYMSDGTSVEFDILVLAVGVKPNTELIKIAGGEVSRGIVTDEHMQTSLPDIYAAGDCVESFDVSSGTRHILALLPNAYMQGECAGASMAGADKSFDKAIPLNAVGFFGLHIATAGTYKGEVFEKRGDGCLKKLFYSDGLLNGFILIGDIAKAGIYTSLIRNNTPLDSIDFGLICEKPSLMAFSRKFRDEKLGGVCNEN